MSSHEEKAFVKKPLSEHLQELRRVLIVSLAAVLISAFACYAFLQEPLMRLVTSPIASCGIELKFTSVTEAFMGYLKVSLLAGLIVASPVVFWQVLRFILPGLYQNEKHVFLLILFWLVVLFITGVCFAYFVVLRFALKALLFTFNGDFEPFITVSNYLGFFIKFLIPFGAAFEIPLMVFFLTRLGLVTPEFLTKYRRYVIVIIVIAAGIFSPPDVLSQILLAVPMYVLYEISVIISRRVVKTNKNNEGNEAQT